MLATSMLAAALCLATARAGPESARKTSRADTAAAALDVKEAWRLFERARMMAGSLRGELISPGVTPTLNFARATLTRAEDELKSGNAVQALDLARRARETLKIAVQLAIGDLTPELVEARLGDLGELKLQAQNLASACPAPGIRDLAARADDRFQLAKDDAGAMRLDRAEAQETIARELYTRIMEICAR